jgi:integrase
MTSAALTSIAARPPVREHVDRMTYRAWVWQHIPSATVRSARMRAFDDFTDRWPRLGDWFQAPLRQRLFERDVQTDCSAGLADATVIMPYLSYLSLVHGVGLDYPLLLGRQFASPFTVAVHQRGLGVDLDLFDSNVSRLIQLGYSAKGAKNHLLWPLGRMLLHRGDPDLTALTLTDLEDLRRGVDEFTALLREDHVRELFARPRTGQPNPDPAGSYFNTAIARIHAAHVLLFHIGQINVPAPGRIDRTNWADNVLPAGVPPKIRAVMERYVRLHLDANLDRPETVRHARDALRSLTQWLVTAHPEITTLAELRREHAEAFLQWAGELTSKHTGQPLAMTTRRGLITNLTVFMNQTATWGWEDTPRRVLFTRGDIPKVAKSLPRFIPEHELIALMAAINELPDPYQRAALIVARWSGARRSEIRWLAVDCLDAYPDGHPRLRIPVGKGYTERSIPLHPEAANVLQPLIDLAGKHAARGQYDASAGRAVNHIFTLRGKLLSNGFLFDLSLKAACTAAGLIDPDGRPMISAHRFRHTIGTQLAEGGARLQTIMAVLGHRTPHMSLIYASLSDPTVKQQYQDALDRHLGSEISMAGPAADALRNHRLDPEAVSWLQTNFLKTELELGHCLRLPQEGPCECDLVLTCSKFLTTSDYAPRLAQRRRLELTLVQDAIERGWNREVERHQSTADRLQHLLDDLDQPAPAPTDS